MKLTPAQLAAIASGATLESLGLSAEQAAAAKAEAEKAEAEKAEAEQAAAAKAEAEKAEDEKPAKPETVTAFLTEQLATAQSEIVNNRVTIAQLQAQVTEMKTTHDSLLTIARSAVAKMQVALGGSGEAAAALDATSVCAEHAKLTETFQKRYPVGGVASAKSEPAKTDEAQPNWVRLVPRTPAN